MQQSAMTKEYDDYCVRTVFSLISRMLCLNNDPSDCKRCDHLSTCYQMLKGFVNFSMESTYKCN